MKKLFATLVLLSLSTLSHAAIIIPASVSGTGTYTHDPGLIIDGFVPAENTVWTNATNVYWNGLTPTFTIDFGLVYQLTDVLVSIDNNDAYLVETSLDGSTWSPLFDIAAGDGEIAVFPGGMDTMNSDAASLEYVPSVDFPQTAARYARIRATGGDNSYAVGELQFFGEALPGSNVPLPGTLLLLLSGLGWVRFANRRR